jgi:hypothetical protein
MERKSFTKETEARGSNTTITTPTPYVSRTPGENLHQVAQWLPPLAIGLVGEGLNESPNSQGCNQCGIIMHTHNVRGSIKVEHNSCRQEYATVFREFRKERQRFTKRTEAR